MIRKRASTIPAAHFERIREATGLNSSYSYERFVEDFSKIILPNPDGEAGLVAARDLGARTFVLSNTSWLHARKIFDNEILASVPEVHILSYKVGMMKPDPRIWGKVLEYSGLAAGDCLYIDDVRQYCDVALSLGFGAFCYDKTTQKPLAHNPKYVKIGLYVLKARVRAPLAILSEVCMKRLLVAMFCIVAAASAFGAGKVVVYTAHEESIINALVPMFEKDTGIKVEYVQAGVRRCDQESESRSGQSAGRRDLVDRRRAARGGECDPSGLSAQGLGQDRPGVQGWNELAGVHGHHERVCG